MADVPFHAGPRAETVFDRAAAYLHGLGRAWTQALAYRRTLRELDQLSDRELDDLGLCRADLRRAAYDAVYRG